MIEIAVSDTKPFDRANLAQAPGAERVAWRFHDFRLSAETASAAKGAPAACLDLLTALGVKLLALRCTGLRAQIEALRAKLSQTQPNPIP